MKSRGGPPRPLFVARDGSCPFASWSCRLCAVRFHRFALSHAIVCGCSCVVPFSPVAVALCLSCPLRLVVLHVAVWTVCAHACSCHRRVFVVVVAAKVWLVDNDNKRNEINRKRYEKKRKKNGGGVPHDSLHLFVPLVLAFTGVAFVHRSRRGRVTFICVHLHSWGWSCTCSHGRG